MLLSAIHDLELVARVIVEGALSGLHRSPFHGYSAEFSQYRHYRPGDDLKYVDWKLFARTDRLYTKQFRETTNVRVQLVLDASASMGIPRRAGASKLEYARLIAAGLAHLVVGAGGRRRADGPRRRDPDLHRSERRARAPARDPGDALEHRHTDGRLRRSALRRAVDLLRTRGVVVLISDLYDDEEAVDGELRRAARMGHDVTVFHVLTPDELQLPGGVMVFEDAETGQTVLVGPGAASEYDSPDDCVPAAVARPVHVVRHRLLSRPDGRTAGHPVAHLPLQRARHSRR